MIAGCVRFFSFSQCFERPALSARQSACTRSLPGRACRLAQKSVLRPHASGARTPNHPDLPQELRKPALPFLERPVAEILTIEFKQIKGAQPHRFISRPFHKSSKLFERSKRCNSTTPGSLTVGHLILSLRRRPMFASCRTIVLGQSNESGNVTMQDHTT